MTNAQADRFFHQRWYANFWARAYICAYYTLYESKCKGDDDTPETLTLPLIERLVKAFKTHRAAIDFDAAFVNGFVPKIEGV